MDLVSVQRLCNVGSTGSPSWGVATGRQRGEDRNRDLPHWRNTRDGSVGESAQAAGVPSIEHGKEIAAAIVSSVKSLRTTYVGAKTTAAALPVDDPAAAQALATQLQVAETTLQAGVAEAAAKYPAPKLDKAFATTKAWSQAGHGVRARGGHDHAPFWDHERSRPSRRRCRRTEHVSQAVSQRASACAR